MAPTHVMRERPVGKQRLRTTWCGIRENDERRFPYVGEQHVTVHVRGHGMTICDSCAAAIDAVDHAADDTAALR